MRNEKRINEKKLRKAEITTQTENYLRQNEQRARHWWRMSIRPTVSLYNSKTAVYIFRIKRWNIRDFRDCRHINDATMRLSWLLAKPHCTPPKQQNWQQCWRF